jgi:hypothetical protein
MKKRLVILISLLCLTSVSWATTIQQVPENSYLVFQYPSGKYRLAAYNNMRAFSYTLTDTTGNGIDATGSYNTLTPSGDTMTVYYWTNPTPDIYYYVETTGADSVMSQPNHVRMGTKTALAGSVDSSAVVKLSQGNIKLQNWLLSARFLDWGSVHPTFNAADSGNVWVSSNTYAPNGGFIHLQSRVREIGRVSNSFLTLSDSTGNARIGLDTTLVSTRYPRRNSSQTVAISMLKRDTKNRFAPTVSVKTDSIIPIGDSLVLAIADGKTVRMAGVLHAGELRLDGRTAGSDGYSRIFMHNQGGAKLEIYYDSVADGVLDLATLAGSAGTRISWFYTDTLAIAQGADSARYNAYQKNPTWAIVGDEFVMTNFVPKASWGGSFPAPENRTVQGGTRIESAGDSVIIVVRTSDVVSKREVVRFYVGRY